METLPLDDRRIDLWYTRTDAVTDPALLDEYRRLLSAEEREDCQRFRFERDRHQYLVARALVRTALSHYTGEDPAAWRFTANAFGKPFVAGASAPLEFNPTHTPGLVACLVALQREVGVDAEDATRPVDCLALARRYFAPDEVAALERLPPEEQPTVFYRFWTFKEAYVKARGLGLSVELDDFAFTLAADQPPTVSFAANVGDDPARWQFAELSLAGRYQVAMAVRSQKGETFAVGVHETVPLRAQGREQVLPDSTSNRWVL